MLVDPTRKSRPEEHDQLNKFQDSRKIIGDDELFTIFDQKHN